MSRILRTRRLVLERANRRILGESEMDCPKATQDLKTNTENRNEAIKAEHIKYGPLNLTDEKYWEEYAKKWKTEPEVAKQSNCGNCVAFDISPRMKDCMENNTGEIGYCWMHHFMCSGKKWCNTWVEGGPIKGNDVSYKKQS
jgi:hypothetical protein